MKKKVWILLLVFSMLVTTIKFPEVAIAGAEEENTDFGVNVKIVEGGAAATDAAVAGEIHTINISAQNRGQEDAVLKVCLLNEDGQTADTQVEVPNLCEEGEITDTTIQTAMEETLKEALTLADGTVRALEGQWKEETDDSGAVTARYLEAALPAGAFAAFDMQLQYRLAEENDAKKTLIRAKAFCGEQEVTETSEKEDEDNETIVLWEVEKAEEENEPAGENATEENVTEENTTEESIPEEDASEENESDKNISDENVPKNVIGKTAKALNPNYLYLDTRGMNLGEDWNASGKDIYLCVESWGTLQKGTLDPDTGYWYWDFSTWSNIDHYFAFTCGDSWAEIQAADYRRTELSDILLSGAGGRVFSQDGTAEELIDNCRVYAIKEGTAGFEGTVLSFYDMTAELDLTSVVAVFSDDAGNSSQEYALTDGKVTVPSDVYTNIKFRIEGQDTQTCELADFAGAGQTVFYYGRTTLPEGSLINEWDFPVEKSGGLSGKGLYFSSDTAWAGAEISVDGGEKQALESLAEEAGTFYYEFPADSAATRQSVIAVYLQDGTIYRFFWADEAFNEVTVSEDIASVDAVYAAARAVYYDATLSKLSYQNTEGAQNDGKGIPYSDGGSVYYYAQGDGVAPISGAMTAVEGEEDVYRVQLPAGYTRIRFAGYPVADADEARYGDGTDMTDIPMGLSEPCFYGDSGDDIVYNGGNRGGYWDELDAVRDAEKGKGTVIVDIPQGSFAKEANTRYVHTAFYDFYTDYELNGNNRDNYLSTANIKSNRIYQPFRQFNQALSSYYEQKNAASPLYWGNFQNYTGSKFEEIAHTLNLLGWENRNKFFYENNSMWGINGAEINYGGQNATQGLVSDSLGQDGELEIKTTDGSTVKAPYFDETFLRGDNSKGTVLGDVYENVQFPFTQEAMKSTWAADAKGTVAYWKFDSKDSATNLRMYQDAQTGAYYLNKSGEVVKGRTTDGVTAEGNFFPFNGSEQSGNAAVLNYGFAMRMDIEFRLTEEGTVLTTEGEAVPIEFNFSGDDDVWIFIDGKLALDIGGDHDVVTGSLNFKDMRYRVSAVKNSSGGGCTPNVEGDFELGAQEIHTLTMFYMERGLWESNMSITYNFPDENLFEVEKRVNTDNVNHDIFDERLFTGSDTFGFTIKNAATHWGEKATTSMETEPELFNDSFTGGTVAPSVVNNIFEYVAEKAGRQDVAHWYAQYEDDANGQYKDSRWGIITRERGEAVRTADYEYLSFDFYFDENRTPSLSNMWVELVDENGKTAVARLSSQNTFGSSSLTQRTWETIKVYLSRLNAETGFDRNSVKEVRLAFRYPTNIYIDNVQFVPATTMDIMTGFTVQQSEIPDYGSVKENGINGEPSLRNAEGAVYSVKNESTGETTYGRVSANGRFSLGDGDVASFSNQFRRGSYLYLEETGVNQEAFTTRWSLYENGSPVTSYGEGESVQNPSSDGEKLVNQEGRSIEDGRIENTDVNSAEANYDSAKDTAERSIVFRSYEQPDNTVIATTLRAVFENTVNTGSITIKKDIAERSAPLNPDTEYEFEITFTNVAGSALEAEPIKTTVKVKAGGETTISGIPLGTDFVIREMEPTDGSRLESIEIEGENPWAEVENDSVQGTVKADTAQCKFIFKNTNRPLLDISVEKKWQDGNGDDISDTIDSDIYIQLQRKYTDASGEHPYEAVLINGQSYLVLRKGYEGWGYEFTGLEKFQDDACTVPYTYRVVEGTVDANGIFTAIEDGGIIVVEEGEYVVDYQCQETTGGMTDAAVTDDMTGNSNQTQSQTFRETIVNKIHYTTNLKIVKVDASEKDKRLSGVEFKLEKGTDNSTADHFEPDASFGTDGGMTIVTGDGENGTILGEAFINDLEEGIYRITETKTASGYSLLKSPLILTIDRTNGCTVQEGETVGEAIAVDDETNTITLTVSNRLLYELPVTGGYIRFYMIAGGLALAGAVIFFYRLQKWRKGGGAKCLYRKFVYFLAGAAVFFYKLQKRRQGRGLTENSGGNEKGYS